MRDVVLLDSVIPTIWITFVYARHLIITYHPTQGVITLEP